MLEAHDGTALPERGMAAGVRGKAESGSEEGVAGGQCACGLAGHPGLLPAGPGSLLTLNKSPHRLSGSCESVYCPHPNSGLREEALKHN